MKPDNDQPKVTLEQLLRVKRAEKPAPEFWAQFERELHAKQLAAIVEPRPWWAPFIRVGSRLARYQMPIGAAAVVALTFVSVSQYDGATSHVSPPVPQGTERVAEPPSASLAAAAVPLHEGAPVPVRNDAPSGGEPDSLLASDASAMRSRQLGAGAMLSDASLYEADAAGELTSPSVAAQMVAANFEVVKSSEPQLVPLSLNRVSALELALSSPQSQSELTSAAAREPLSQTGAEVSQRRASRLLASALPATATVVVAASAKVDSALRLDRSISEERLYDSMRRGRLSADRVPIKF